MRIKNDGRIFRPFFHRKRRTYTASPSFSGYLEDFTFLLPRRIRHPTLLLSGKNGIRVHDLHYF